MRFRLNEFEQLFAQGDLEKGLRLLRRKSPEITGRKGSHFGYSVATHNITFNRSGEEISHCFCDCGRNFCHHLAAVMLSLLEESAIAVRSGIRTAPAREKPALRDFRITFNELQGKWKSLERAGDQQVALSSFIALAKQHLKTGSAAADLAVLAALSLPGRVSATSDAVTELTNKILLRQFGGASLRTDQDLLYYCLLELLRTNDRVSSGRISALLPVYLAVSTDMFRIEEIRSVLAKRHLRKFHADLFDELQVARHMVIMRATQLTGKHNTLARSSSPESFVALARLHFAGQEISEGWRIMDELKKITRETAPLSYFELLNYLMSLSKALNDAKRQLQYAEELMLYSPYLNQALVQEYLALLSPSGREDAVRGLMNRVLSTRAESATDKIYVLSLASGVTDVFLSVLQRSQARFYMVHEVFMKYYHGFSEEQNAIYFQQLLLNLEHPAPHQSTVSLLDQAAEYVRALQSAGHAWHRKIAAALESRALLRPFVAHWQALASKPERLSLQA